MVSQQSVSNRDYYSFKGICEISLPNDTIQIIIKYINLNLKYLHGKKEYYCRED